jgi:hypothetical protein
VRIIAWVVVVMVEIEFRQEGCNLIIKQLCRGAGVLYTVVWNGI